MSNPTPDIGIEIKILRERLRIPAKELARKVGLSQSQISRLEKGQRRIDIRVLSKIAEALGVEPAFFLRKLEQPADAPELRQVSGQAMPTFAPPLRYEHVGKLVRSERRRRHLTAAELADKVGKTAAFVNAFEEGRHVLDPQLADRLAKALKVTPNFFLAAHQEQVRALEGQVARLHMELADRHRGGVRTIGRHRADPRHRGRGPPPRYAGRGGVRDRRVPTRRA